MAESTDTPGVTTKTPPDKIDEIVDKLLTNPKDHPEDVRIHDSLWGAMKIKKHELDLIDTPLFQRLRRIKQLGSAHLVFPSAQHTRFEHTLGVTHLTGQACKALSATKPGSVNKWQATNLRVAALCHDLGHGPFSHHSESFLERLAMKTWPDGATEDSGAAEQLSARIVRSGPMQEFFNEIERFHGVELDSSFIADAISGRMEGALAYLGDIVHGPFDVDKLDYLTRDGKFCGIPVYVGIDRIFSMLTLAQDENSSKRLAGQRGGATAMAQLVHLKHHMHSVVYQHYVTRTFGAMLNNALDCALEEGTEICGVRLECPADLLLLDDQSMLAPGSADKDSRTGQLLEAMRNRQLFKQAWVIEGSSLDDNTRCLLEDEKSVLCMRKKIASSAGLELELVAIDYARPVPNKEAWNLLIVKEGQAEPEKLGKLMDLKEEGVPLHDFLERHLVLCPAEHVNKVRKAARKVIDLPGHAG